MSAKSVCGMSCGQMHEFAIALDKAGFNAKLVQEVVSSRGNSKAKRMFAALSGAALEGDRFDLIEIFPVTVPEGYDHVTRLATFASAHRQEFYSYHDDLTDQSFAKATTKLVAGRKFQVKAFQIKGRVTSEDCLTFVKSQKGVLVGAQGASLAYEQGKDKLPVNRRSISFDEKDSLPVLGGFHRVPKVRRDSDGDFGFGLGYFGGDWTGGDVLLVFCDLESA